MSERVSNLVAILTSPVTSESGNVITRAVAVPSTEHVAQIVGRNGSKVKQLRESTNTYIKTPLRDDEPMFLVTGEPDNVEKAVDSIWKASLHFSKIMEEKSTICAIGEVSISVQVPSQHVGSVVGSNGRVIKKIKQDTKTRINTPRGRPERPAFIVTGRLEDVYRAKKAIEEKVAISVWREQSLALDQRNQNSRLISTDGSIGRQLFNDQNVGKDSRISLDDIYLI